MGLGFLTTTAAPSWCPRPPFVEALCSVSNVLPECANPEPSSSNAVAPRRVPDEPAAGLGVQGRLTDPGPRSQWALGPREH